IFSTTILMFPFVYKENEFVPFIDVLFTAVSTLTVTGLSTISIGDTFTTPGLIMLTIIMHLGAVGIMAVSTSIWLLLGKRIGLAERRLIMQDQNQRAFSGMVTLNKQIVLAIVIVEIIGILILGAYFVRYFNDVSEAYLNGFLITITALSSQRISLDDHSLAMY